MYLSKAKRETLSTMVLAHRVAVRKAAKVSWDSTEERWALWDAEEATQSAIELALDTDGSADWRWEQLYRLTRQGQQDARVALIRLESLGIKVDWAQTTQEAV